MLCTVACQAPGISQVRTLEWVAFPSPGDLPDPGIEPASPSSPALSGRLFATESPGKPGDRVHCPITIVKAGGPEHGLWSMSLAAEAPRLSCSVVCGAFQDQGLTPCPLHWQADP